ncbi:MAG: hypothetical protein J07HQX50_02558, partial [Haloquadratum sp. J07HQX50]
AIAHTVSSVPGFNLPPDTVYYAWEDHILVDPLTLTEGAILVPDGPGLGVEVDERKLAEYGIDI